MRRDGVTEHIHNTGYGYELISIACIFCDVGKYPRDKYPRGCFPLLCGGVKMIYLDNGATSFPKPPEVTEAIVTAVTDYCANPGRAGHAMAARTAEGVFRARDSIAELFSIEDPARIVFTKNCTESLNLALKGLLRPGDHVITTSMEHNSVIRPLHQLSCKGVSYTMVGCDMQGRLHVDEMKKAIRPETRMIVMTAASNVTGTKMPLEEAGRVALRHGLIFLVDGAQGAGHMEIDVKKQHIDVLAVPGHKGLLGPQGTGALYVRKGLKLRPLMEGGTGTRSREREQPMEFPEGYEAGTVNSPGIIALGEGARVVQRMGISAIEEYERHLTERLGKALAGVDGVSIYGPEDAGEKTAVVAINIDGMDCEEVADILDRRYGIAVRAGFHCSGCAHDTIGTGDIGCVRICPGIYTTENEIDAAVAAIKEISSQAMEQSRCQTGAPEDNVGS